ncbi:MAG: radical SAM protein [Candidatus Omnitrophica bacterium]|nr:radical SAM protein [Candidatus Omnitrophota bacterium]
MKKFKYLYGPVSSWRLGRSFGIDLLSQKEKMCSFNCVYCQVGTAKPPTAKSALYVPTADIIREIRRLPPDLDIDYLTFSGRGEPTLAKNLGEIIRAVRRERRYPIAVLTNATLLSRPDVRKALSACDVVSVKLDAGTSRTLRLVNRPDRGISLERIIDGIRHFRKMYKGKLALQVMFIKANKKEAAAIARLAKTIRPDEVQINTPRRRPYRNALSAKEIQGIKRYFKGFNVVSAYDKPKRPSSPLTGYESVKLRGRGKG